MLSELFPAEVVQMGQHHKEDLQNETASSNTKSSKFF